MLFGKLGVEAKEAGDDFAFLERGREAVGGHDGAVVDLMGAAQFGGMILYYMFSFTTHSPFVLDPFLSKRPLAFRRESSR